MNIFRIPAGKQPPF